jgi:hypothetical protein
MARTTLVFHKGVMMNEHLGEARRTAQIFRYSASIAGQFVCLILLKNEINSTVMKRRFEIPPNVNTVHGTHKSAQ